MIIIFLLSFLVYFTTIYLKYLNIIKVNSKIKNTIKVKITKNYQINNFNPNIKKVNYIINKALLKDIRKIYLNLKRIYNTSTL